MSMPKLVIAGLLLFTTPLFADSGPNLGKPVSAAVVRNWNQDVFPNGKGLPKGQGNAKQGERVYEKYCVSCHGVEGSGGYAEELAGAQHGLTDNPPDKVIGTYWPYATTLFDFTRRSMPLDAPGSLSNDQIYAVTAYLLFLNEIIDIDKMVNANSLAKIKMPNREGFINIFKQEQTK